MRLKGSLMNVAPGSDQANGSPKGVSPRARAPRTLQPVEALIARRRLSALAIERGIKGATFIVWSFLLDSTICWQRETEYHFHAYIAEQTGLSKRAVEVAVVALRDAGLIAYEGGRPSQAEGRNKPSRFTILHVRGVLAAGVPHTDVVPLPHGDVAPPTDVTPLPHGDVAPSRTGVSHPATQACGTVPHGDVSYRGENSPEEELPRENTGVGAQVVRLEPSPRPTSGGADAQAVLDAYCEVRAKRGTPVVRPRPYLPYIQEALSANYSATEVLIGMGMWDAEGYRTPKQIPEWVEKSREQGEVPSDLMSVPALLDEGRRRYNRYFARKTASQPARADERRQRSIRAIQEFNRGAL